MNGDYSNVVNIEDLRIARVNSAHETLFKTDKCQHLKLTVDSHTDSITCDDCKLQITPMAALRIFIDQYRNAYIKLKNQAAAQKEVAEKQLHLKVTQKLEKMWRGGLVPCCPHCGEGILLTDNLGSQGMSKEWVIRTREAKKK